MNNGTKRQHGLLPYSVIASAVQGEPDAVKAVIRHYSNYMASLCLRTGCGVSMDWDMYHRLEIRLTAAISTFRLN